MAKTSRKSRKVGFISTYVPRECGIGTFTNDIVKNISLLHSKPESGNSDLLVVAISDRENFYSYPPEVKFEIIQQEKKNYINAANFLNNSDVDVINIQHEFGIFGGNDGIYILDTLDKLRKPVVTAFHTVLENPSPSQKYIVERLSERSVHVVALSQKAVSMLKSVYAIPPEKVVFIEHGAPDVPFMDSSYYKKDLNASGRKIILSFGLLNPNKGLEYGIRAMQKVVKTDPSALYIILGATHPEIRKQTGEQYRLSLELLTKKLGLENNIEFFNYFVTKQELIKFLIACDIYLTPYLSREQIVSGTLAYALTCGKALISTPYWYAEELLKNNRGILVPFRDETAISDAIISLLKNEKEFSELRKNAYDFGREFTWSSVAAKYENIFGKAIENYSYNLTPETVLKKTILPEINLNHMKNLTDDTGIFQHSTMSVPNRLFGYTTDDNARALLVTAKNWHLRKNEDVLPYMLEYLSFILSAYDDSSKTVQNLLSFQRIWRDSEISEDTAGRVVWVLGYLLKHSPNDSIQSLSINLFRKTISNVLHFTSPRAWAFIVSGSVSYLNVFPGDLSVRKTAAELANRIYTQLSRNKNKKWIWPEDTVTYENGRLPQALMSYGGFFSDKKIFAAGRASFEWLINVQTNKKNGRFSLIGNKGWMKREGRKSRFDQQPVEISAIIDAAYEGYKYTGERYFEDIIENGIDWFLGNNDVGQPVYDFSTGGSRDGLHSVGVNLNEGAESTLSWLLSIHTLYELHQFHRK